MPGFCERCGLSQDPVAQAATWVFGGFTAQLCPACAHLWSEHRWMDSDERHAFEHAEAECNRLLARHDGESSLAELLQAQSAYELAECAGKAPFREFVSERKVAV